MSKFICPKKAESENVNKQYRAANFEGPIEFCWAARLHSVPLQNESLFHFDFSGLRVAIFLQFLLQKDRVKYKEYNRRK